MKPNKLTPVVGSLVFAAATQFSGAVTTYNLNNTSTAPPPADNTTPGVSYLVETGTAAGNFTVTGVAVGSAIFTVNQALLIASTTGTGNFDPFMSLQDSNNTREGGTNDGQQEAYNASFKNFDSNTGGNPGRNRDLLFSDLRAVTISGTSYFSFLIDVNEPDNANDKFISLDALKIYTSSGQITTVAGLTGLASPRFDVDVPAPGSYITYNDDLGGSGSGKGDIAFYVPVSAFNGVAMTDYVYMYQKWGTNLDASSELFDANSGFEETAVGLGVALVPEPGSMAGLMGLLAGGAFLRSRRRPTA